MTLDELRGHVADVLATPLSDDRTLQELRSRVNGADPNQLLVAALSVAREQAHQIVGLEYVLDEREQWCQQLEDEAQEARELQERLVRERKQLARKTREAQEQIKRLAVANPILTFVTECRIASRSSFTSAKSNTRARCRNPFSLAHSRRHRKPTMATAAQSRCRRRAMISTMTCPSRGGGEREWPPSTRLSRLHVEQQSEAVMRHCNHCKQEITQSPVAPIIVSISDPENIGPDGIEVSFCCWECAAMWFNKGAGEILMPDLDSEFFGSESDHMRKWG